jgi:hypothetical protein
VTHWRKIPEQLELVLVVVQAAALACIPLVVWLSGKLGKRGAFALIAGVWSVVMLALAARAARARVLGQGPGSAARSRADAVAREPTSSSRAPAWRSRTRRARRC